MVDFTTIQRRRDAILVSCCRFVDGRIGCWWGRRSMKTKKKWRKINRVLFSLGYVLLLSGHRWCDVMLLLLLLCCWRCSFDLLFKCRKTTTGFCSISYAVCCCCCCRRCFCSVVVIVFSFSFCCCLQPNQPNERPSTSRLFYFTSFWVDVSLARSLSLSVLCLFFSSALCSVQNKHTYLCIQLNGRINKRIVGENGRTVGRTDSQSDSWTGGWDDRLSVRTTTNGQDVQC